MERLFMVRIITVPAILGLWYINFEPDPLCEGGLYVDIVQVCFTI